MAFEFRMTFAAEFIEYDKYVGEIQRQLRRLMREAAGIYYNNIILRVPVYTGFLAGSFAPIREASGRTTVSPSSPVFKARNSHYTHFGTHRVLKTVSSGRQFTTPVHQVLTELTDNKTRYRLIFQFNNEIRYYPINDLYTTGSGRPWRATEKATRAAVVFIEANISKIVDLAAGVSIKKQVISYRPGVPPQKIRV